MTTYAMQSLSSQQLFAIAFIVIFAIVMALIVREGLIELRDRIHNLGLGDGK